MSSGSSHQRARTRGAHDSSVTSRSAPTSRLDKPCLCGKSETRLLSPPTTDKCVCGHVSVCLCVCVSACVCACVCVGICVSHVRSDSACPCVSVTAWPRTLTIAASVERRRALWLQSLQMSLKRHRTRGCSRERRVGVGAAEAAPAEMKSQDRTRAAPGSVPVPWRSAPHPGGTTAPNGHPSAPTTAGGRNRGEDSVVQI